MELAGAVEQAFLHAGRRPVDLVCHSMGCQMALKAEGQEASVVSGRDQAGAAG